MRVPNYMVLIWIPARQGAAVRKKVPADDAQRPRVLEAPLGPPQGLLNPARPWHPLEPPFLYQPRQGRSNARTVRMYEFRKITYNMLAFFKKTKNRGEVLLKEAKERK